MSKAIKCDRCKKCFDPYESRCDFTTIRELIFQDGKNFSNDEVGYRDEEINFCPNCTMQFSGWMARKLECQVMP